MGLEGMVATVVLAVVRADQALIGHMGDSRAYLWREGRLRQLTADHSLAQLMVECGELKPEEARHHPARERLTRGVGMIGNPVPEVKFVALHPADRLLLCTDGLVKMVADEEIAAIVNVDSDPESVCRGLADAANQAGGRDNVTVVVAGTGIAGLAFGLWLKLAGAHVITLGRRPQRLEKARRLGADTTVNTSDGDYLEGIRRAAGGAVDGLVEATGDADLAAQLLRVLKPKGFACAYGVPPTGVQYPTQWTKAEVEEHRALPWVADLIRRGWVRADDFVTDIWRLEQAVDAFAAVERGHVLKGFIAF